MPDIGIMGCLFSPEYTNQLIIKSKGRINLITLNTGFNFNSVIQWYKRDGLSVINSSFDKFDQFFFTSLKWCMPKEFVEDFEQIESHYEGYFKKFRNLRYIVSEIWTSDTYTSIALAIANKNGVKHICNEHNYLSHHFLGNNNRKIINLVDLFMTLGWEDKRIPNLVRSGSLFKWKEDKIFRKKIDILFIDGISLVKFPEFNAAYGDSGPSNAQRFIEFNKKFFMSLSNNTINKIIFRPYPIHNWSVSLIKPMMVSYDHISNDLNQYLQYCKRFDWKSKDAKLLIAKSKLVIVNYLSTAYLEAIIADVPTIFFWNKESYYLNDEYFDFYDSLISVGICQTDPIKGALFVEKVKDNPEEWWQSESVRQALNTFLSRNIGSPKLFIDYLLKLQF